MFFADPIIDAIAAFLTNTASFIHQTYTLTRHGLNSAAHWLAVEKPWWKLALAVYTIIGLFLFLSIFAVLVTAIVVLLLTGLLVLAIVSLSQIYKNNVRPAERIASARRRLPSRQGAAAYSRRLWPGERLHFAAASV